MTTTIATAEKAPESQAPEAQAPEKVELTLRNPRYVPFAEQYLNSAKQFLDAYYQGNVNVETPIILSRKKLGKVDGYGLLVLETSTTPPPTFIETMNGKQQTWGFIVLCVNGDEITEVQDFIKGGYTSLEDFTAAVEVVKNWVAAN